MSRALSLRAGENGTGRNDRHAQDDRWREELQRRHNGRVQQTMPNDSSLFLQRHPSATQPFHVSSASPCAEQRRLRLVLRARSDQPEHLCPLRVQPVDELASSASSRHAGRTSRCTACYDARSWGRRTAWTRWTAAGREEAGRRGTHAGRRAEACEDRISWLVSGMLRHDCGSSASAKRQPTGRRHRRTASAKAGWAHTCENHRAVSSDTPSRHEEHADSLGPPGGPGGPPKSG